MPYKDIEQKRINGRAWRLKNREKVLALARAKYDPEKERERRKTKKKPTPEQNRAARIRYMAKHRDKVLLSRKDRYYNKGGKQQNELWRQKNIVRSNMLTRINRHRAHAKKKGEDAIEIMLADMVCEQICKLKIFFCFYCNKVIQGDDITIDHIVPKFNDGKHSPDNIVVACDHCNCSKHTRPAVVYYEELKQNGQIRCQELIPLTEVLKN